jgi:hypothetical protein
MQISRSLELATSGNEVQGTLRYLAPEVQRGEPADERSDIYSWGVLLFETLTGKLPEGREVPSDLVKNVPPELDQVFEACFQRREKRPRTLDSGITALERLLAVGPKPKGAPDEDGGNKASRAIPFRAHDGLTLITPLSNRGTLVERFATQPEVDGMDATKPPKPDTADALHTLRMLGAPAAPGALPAMPAEGVAAGWTAYPGMPPAPRVETSRSETKRLEGVPPTPRVPAGVAPPELDLGPATKQARTDDGFQRWREAFIGVVRSRFELRPAGATLVPAEGFDLAIGVTTEGEPHHRIYTVLLPYVDQDTARRLVRTARSVFEREKGIWEKEVTFAVLAREVREKELVLMTLRALPMGWWRRRRVVLHDVSQDKLYATELGCDPRGNPLKRLFFESVREAIVHTGKLADATSQKRCCGRVGTVRAGRECVRNGLLGVALALVATLGLLAAALSVEKGLNRMGKHRRHGSVSQLQEFHGTSMRADPHPPTLFDPFAVPQPQAPSASVPVPAVPANLAVPAPVSPEADLPRTQTRDLPGPALEEEDQGWLDTPEAPAPAPAPKVYRY